MKFDIDPTGALPVVARMYFDTAEKLYAVTGRTHHAEEGFGAKAYQELAEVLETVGRSTERFSLYTRSVSGGCIEFKETEEDESDPD